MDDSTAMTIDFLRARLLAERSVSRTARQRADELAQRVMELEEQLKIVSLQRKRAEKATAEVLAILETHGRSDVSETFDSSSDQEADIGTSSVKREEPSINRQNRENDGDTCSGSEHESSSQIGRSLSWKSSRDSLHSLEKKYMDSSRRRRNAFATNGGSFSPKHVGKSCRQIRRREHRSAVEQSENDDRSAHGEAEMVTSSEGVNIYSDIENGISRKVSENHNERDIVDTPASVVLRNYSESNGHYRDNHRGDKDMERALQYQAHLIGRFEAEEKAQREWEEKFRENNGSTQDSCDPGNQSDVTEERDDIKAAAISCSNGMISSQNPEDEFGKGEASQDKDFNAPSAQPSEGKVDEDNLDQQPNPQPHTAEQSPDLHHMPVNDLANISSSDVHNSFKEEAPGIPNDFSFKKGVPEIPNDFALTPRENSDKLGSVLEALQKAKLSIKQNLNRSSLQEDGMIHRAIEPSFPIARHRDRYAMPVGSAGLFRLPTDYQYGVTGRVNSLGSTSKFSTSNFSPGPASANFSSSPYRESESSSSNDNRFLNVPTFPYPEVRPRVPTRSPIFESGISPTLTSFSNRYTNLDPLSNAGLPTQPLVFYPSPSIPSSSASLPAMSPTRDPMFDMGQPYIDRYSNIYPHSNAGLPSSNIPPETTRPSYPDFFPRISSNRDAGLSPSQFSFYDNNTRPNMYR